jgi:hypothetical protein
LKGDKNMTPKLFCLILGFAIGAALIGLIWIVWYVIHKEPDRLEHGQRTNRPEHWTQIKTFVSEDAIRTGKVAPKIPYQKLEEARKLVEQYETNMMMQDELEKILERWNDG